MDTHTYTFITSPLTIGEPQQTANSFPPSTQLSNSIGARSSQHDNVSKDVTGVKRTNSMDSSANSPDQNNQALMTLAADPKLDSPNEPIAPPNSTTHRNPTVVSSDFAEEMNTTNP